jgi:hypothetical protein
VIVAGARYTEEMVVDVGVGRISVLKPDSRFGVWLSGRLAPETTNSTIVT